MAAGKTGARRPLPWNGPHTAQQQVTARAPGAITHRSPSRARQAELDRHPSLVIAAPFLFIPFSSVTGLSYLIIGGSAGPALLSEIWSVNLWGDLIFIGGTWGSFILCRHYVSWAFREKGSMWFASGAVPLTFFLTWGVYSLSWAFTGPALFSGSNGFLFFDPSWTWEMGRVSAYMVFGSGIIGLVAMALFMPAVAIFMERRTSGFAP